MIGYSPRANLMREEDYISMGSDPAMTGVFGQSFLQGFESNIGFGTPLAWAQTPDTGKELAGFQGPYPLYRIRTPEQVEALGDHLYQSPEELTKDFPEIPFEPGMTKARASVLQEHKDLNKIRDYWAEKRPWAAMFGRFLGGAVDWVNFIPILGEETAAANMARLGTVAGRTATMSADAVINTALAHGVFGQQRQSLGFDESWQSIATDIGFAALAGAGVGAVRGRFFDLSRPSTPNLVPQSPALPRTPENVMKAQLVTNDAIGGVVDNGRVDFNVNSQAMLNESFIMYHGSPHKFDQLSSEKIGTGEGFQSFSHGLYGGEARGTGESYRESNVDEVTSLARTEMALRSDPAEAIKKLQSYINEKRLPHGRTVEQVQQAIEKIKSGDVTTPIKIDGKEFVARDLIDKMTEDFIVKANGDVSKAIELAKSDLADFAPEGRVLLYQEQLMANESKQVIGKLESLSGSKVTVHKPGYLYEVKVNVSKDHLLDHDKSLSEQTDYVKERLKAASEDLSKASLFADDFTKMQHSALKRWMAEADAKTQGGTLTKALESIFRGPADVAKFLRDHGIPGVKYLDQVSRKEGEGTRNFVIFDDKLLKVLKRNDEPLDFHTPPEEEHPEFAAAEKRVAALTKQTDDAEEKLKAAKEAGVDAETGKTDLDPVIEQFTKQDEQPTFTTSKGSTYLINEDGTTTRNKSFHPEHGAADQGPQPKSEQTFYVSKEDVEKLGEFQARGMGKKAIVVHGGRAGIKYLEGKDAGKIEKRTMTDIKTKPEVGLIPVELWNDGKRVHFGNEITEVKTGGQLSKEDLAELEAADKEWQEASLAHKIANIALQCVQDG